MFYSSESNKLTPKLKNAVLEDIEEESVQEFKNEFKMSMEELVAGCPLLIAKEQKDDADAEWCGSGFTRKEDGDVDFASKVLDAGGFEFHSVLATRHRSEYLEHRMTALLEELITFRSGSVHTCCMTRRLRLLMPPQTRQSSTSVRCRSPM